MQYGGPHSQWWITKVDATKGESQPSTMYLIKANAKKRTILVFITGLPPIPSEYIFPCCASDDDEASSKKQMETVPKNYCASDEINQGSEPRRDR